MRQFRLTAAPHLTVKPMKCHYALRFVQGLPPPSSEIAACASLGGNASASSWCAIFQQANLLLLDEATSDIDTASEQHIQDSIDALPGEVTVVMIAHRLSTIKNADRVYVLDQGRVIEAGEYHELRMRDDGRFGNRGEMQSH